MSVPGWQSVAAYLNSGAAAPSPTRQPRPADVENNRNANELSTIDEDDPKEHSARDVRAADENGQAPVVPPLANHVAETVFFKTVGKYPAPVKAFEAARNAIYVAWQGKQELLVPPCELKQRAESGGNDKSTGLGDMVRKPFGDHSYCWQGDMKKLNLVVGRASSNILKAASIYPMKKGDCLAEKLNYVNAVQLEYYTIGPGKADLNAGEEPPGVIFLEGGIENCTDRSWGRRPVMGTTCDEKTLAKAIKWFTDTVKADKSKKYNGLVHVFEVDHGRVRDTDGIFFTGADAIHRNLTVLVHYNCASPKDFVASDEDGLPAGGYNMMACEFAPFFKKLGRPNAGGLNGLDLVPMITSR